MSSTIFFFLFIPLLAFILLAINLVFAPHNPYQEKDSAFECGFSSFLGQNRTQFSISFFIFALLFLLFDLEILLVYPYLVSAYTNDIYGLATMLMFLLALTLGFAFELGKKALSIDSRQTSNCKSKQYNKIAGLMVMPLGASRRSYSSYSKIRQFFDAIHFIRSIIDMVKTLLYCLRCPYHFLYSRLFDYIKSYLCDLILKTPLCVYLSNKYCHNGIYNLNISELGSDIYYGFIHFITDFQNAKDIFIICCVCFYSMAFIHYDLFLCVLQAIIATLLLFSFISLLVRLFIISPNLKTDKPFWFILGLFASFILFSLSCYLFSGVFGYLILMKSILYSVLGGSNGQGPYNDHPGPQGPNDPSPLWGGETHETSEKKRRREGQRERLRKQRAAAFHQAELDRVIRCENEVRQYMGEPAVTAQEASTLIDIFLDLKGQIKKQEDFKKKRHDWATDTGYEIKGRDNRDYYDLEHLLRARQAKIIREAKRGNLGTQGRRQMSSR